MSKNRVSIFSLLLMFVLFVYGCASIPKWVQGPLSYQENDYIYIVGYSAPTMYQHDAESYAKDKALYELAKIMKVEVRQTVVDIMTEKGKDVGSYDSFISVAETTVDEAVKNAEPVAVWYDKDGKLKSKGSAYALVRMKKANVEQLMKDKIK